MYCTVTSIVMTIVSGWDVVYIIKSYAKSICRVGFLELFLIEEALSATFLLRHQREPY